MSFQDRYNSWFKRSYVIRKNNENKKKMLLVLLALLAVEDDDDDDDNNKNKYLSIISKKCREYSFYYKIFPKIYLNNSVFRNYFHMNPCQFEQLLCIIAPSIITQNKYDDCDKKISIGERLALTLRFLTSGDSKVSMSNQHVLDLKLINSIIIETCDALWNCLNTKVVPSKISKDNWINISNDFDEKWNFKHCVGAIDARHIIIQESGDENKEKNKFIIIGICDANYNFTFINIADYACHNVNEIFNESHIDNNFTIKMNLPKPKALLKNGKLMPYVIVGNNLFPLKNYLLRPYNKNNNLNNKKLLFNRHLNYAHSTIDNSFGILISLWKIFRKPINSNHNETIKIIRAIICIHNWLLKLDNDKEYITPLLVDSHDKPGTWRKYYNKNCALQNINKYNNDAIEKNSAVKIRNEFCKYFSYKAITPCQFDHCYYKNIDNEI